MELSYGFMVILVVVQIHSKYVDKTLLSSYFLEKGLDYLSLRHFSYAHGSLTFLLHRGSQCYDMINANRQFEDPILNPETVCENTPSLNKNQMGLCRMWPDVVASALQGMQLAVHECQAQYRYRRWNCSSLEMKNGNPMTNPILSRGFRETAFIHAIIAAGVTSAIAKSCSHGKLHSCGCDPSMRGKGDGWKWGGCGDNIDYGAMFSKKFLNAEETGHDIHSKMKLHNNMVGMTTVQDNSKTKCKCHGMCGSCSVKTCWKTVPNFREVGDRLMEKYDYATLIRAKNRSSGKVKIRPVRKKIRRSNFKEDLVYFEKSPNYCYSDKSLLISGTSGRICSTSSLDTDNCERLCCGRPFMIKQLSVSKRCRCHFNWCCYVICDTCSESSVLNVCI